MGVERATAGHDGRVAADLDGEAVAGTVVDLHPVAVELETPAGRRVTVPNSTPLQARLDVERPAGDGSDPRTDRRPPSRRIRP